MSDGKRMGLLEVIRTILKESPGLRARYLVKEVHDKAHLSRSTIYVHLDSLVNCEEIFRDRGRYWIQDPRKDYHAQALDRKMSDHYRSAVKALREYSAYQLLRLVDSGEFQTRFPEFAGHVRTGYKKLFRLFQRWRELPLPAKVEHVDSEEQGLTEAREKLANDILREVDLELDFVIRRVKNGSKLEGKCDYCPI